MRVHYRGFSADVEKHAGGVTALECAMPTIIVAVSGVVRVNGRQLSRGLPHVLPGKRTYIVDCAEDAVTAVVTVARLSSFSVGPVTVEP